MKKLLVYPYNEKTSSLVTYNDYLKDYILETIITLKGNEIQGYKDVNDIIFTNDFNDSLSKCDSLLLCSGFENYNTERYITMAKLAYQYDKDILIDKNVYEAIKDFIKEIEVKVIGVLTNEEWKNSKLYSIDIPVITVSSLGEECGKFDTEIFLNKEIKDRGYNVLTIGSNNLSELFGMKLLPQELFLDSLSAVKKIERLNEFLYMQVKETKADVLILGIPGGILPINSDINNFFGELAYIISKSIQIDINILCTYFYNDMNKEYLDDLNRFTQNFMGCETEYFNMSDTKYLIDKERENIFQTFSVSKEEVKETLNRFSKNHIDIFNTKYHIGTQTIVDKILSELSENAEVI